MTDLEIATTDELIEELQKRHTASMIVMLSTTKTEDGEKCTACWHGGKYVVMGMVYRMINRLNKIMNQEDASEEMP